MFGLFRKKRSESGSGRRGSAPPLSADLKAERDREFVDRLQKGLDAQLRSVGPGKIEPSFKPRASAAETASPPSAASKPEARREPGREPASPRAEASPRPEVKAANGTANGVAPAAKPAAAPHPPSAATSPVAPAPAAGEQAQPIPALPLVMRAAQFAADRHKAQRRKGAAREPYVNHVLEVATLLADASEGKDPDLVIAGLLHDLVEDQGVSVDEVATKFGMGVAALVLEVTDDKSLPSAERRQLQVVNAPHKSPRARMLRIADVVSNLRALRQGPPADWPAERQRDYLQWARQLVAGCRGVNTRLDSAFDEVDAGFKTGAAAPESTDGSAKYGNDLGA